MHRARVPSWAIAFALVAVAVLTVATAGPAEASSDPLAGRTLVGRLVQAWPEHADARAPEAAQPLSWVDPASGPAVRVPTDDVAGLPAGSTVRVTVGAQVPDDPAPGAGDVGVAHQVLSGSVVSVPPAPAPASDSPPTGADTDEVTIVAADVSPASAAAASVQLQDAVTGPVHDFWAGQTGGRVRFGAAAPVTWIPSAPIDCTDPTSVWAAAARAAGFVPGPGRHLLVHLGDDLPGVAGCAYGLAEVGQGIGSGGDLYVRDVLPALVAHELGHNLGLGHSSGELCDGATDTGTCRVVPYRDYYDVMGASWEHLGSLTGPQAARLGVLPDAQRQVVDAGGRGGPVTLSPLGGRTGIRAVELTAPGDAGYWLEYRTATGQDSWLTGNRLGLQAGVLVHRSGDLPDTSLLLDATPSAATAQDDDLQEALPLGRPVDLADGFTVTLESVGETRATVQVTATATAAAAATASAPASAAGPGAVTPPAQHPTTLPAGSTAQQGSGRSHPGTAAPRATAGAGLPAGGTPAGGTPVGPAAVSPRVAATPAAANGVPTLPAALVRSSAPAVGCVLGGCAALGGLVLVLRRRVRRAP